MRSQVLSGDARAVMLAGFLVYRSIPCFKNPNTHLEGCSSFADLLSCSSQLGIPLRDLLRLVPILLSSASGSQSLLFPLQAFPS
ncbi:hypothetical protein ILYODFUR_009448 [Ilyodon furcidens]|uniref:Uncharacterized protein n=1 Tax=Ilyodon furcidens TaxID=33524 RepID=A0ABV0UEM3_9TELE